MIEGSDFGISPTVVAWYGAALATLMALIRAWDAWKDRPFLKVTFTPNIKAANHPDLSGEGTYIHIGVTNGRRPTWVSAIYLTTRKRPEGLVVLNSTPQFPCLLSEGAHLYSLVEQVDIDLETIACAIVEDGLGRKYRCPVAPLYKRIWWRLRF